MARFHHLGYHLLIVTLVTFIGTAVTQEEEEKPITVGADVTAIEIGDTAKIECSTTTTETFKWYRGDAAAEKLISQDDSLRVHANFTTGLLTITGAQQNDTGEYLCQLSSGNHSVTAQLHVYKMPSYFTEGVIIFGINMGLVLVFIGCALYSFIHDQKETKADKTKKKVSTEL